jgi:hypothetical protein
MYIYCQYPEYRLCAGARESYIWQHVPSYLHMNYCIGTYCNCYSSLTWHTALLRFKISPAAYEPYENLEGSFPFSLMLVKYTLYFTFFYT